MEKFELILDAVERLVALHGSDCVTTTLVAQETGVAVGTIYQYFGNREDLLIAAHDRLLSRLATDLTNSVTSLDIMDSHAADRAIRLFVQKAQTYPGYLSLLKYSYLHKTTRHSEVTASDFIGHLISLFISVRAPNTDKEDLMVTRTVAANILTIMTNVLLLEPDPRVQERYLKEMINHCNFALERAAATQKT